jgi:transposase-like protein
MNGEQQSVMRRRRTSAEVKQLVEEFVSGGMQQSEFCRSRGLSFSTLDRHLKKQRWQRKRKSDPRSSVLLPVELSRREKGAESESICRLVVVLWGGRKIEVHDGFDSPTFERLMNLLERV